MDLCFNKSACNISHVAFDLEKKHLTHSIENIEIYIVYRHSAKKYRDIIFCSYRAALPEGHKKSVAGVMGTLYNPSVSAGNASWL